MIHIYFNDDAKPHDLTDNGSMCECHPKVIIHDSELIIVHTPFSRKKEILTNKDVEQILDATGDVDGDIVVDDY